jgi:hypothetical protein
MYKKRVSIVCNSSNEYTNEDDKPKLEDYEVLRNFKDVFADEIPELPPRREIDFSIDLIPGFPLYQKHHTK